MRAGRASRTAEQNALFRALETARPASERVCDDPFARHFLGWPFTLVMWAGTIPGAAALIRSYIDGRWPGARTSVIARTRLIDDLIPPALEKNIEQLVILGAGFDSRAYRMPRLAAIEIFEVDHPDTQAAKRRTLSRVLPSPPPNVRFVAVDFKRDSLADAMPVAGYRASTSTLLVWEGVTNYLTAEAVEATLRWCAGASPGSLLLFTYVRAGHIRGRAKPVHLAREGRRALDVRPGPERGPPIPRRTRAHPSARYRSGRVSRPIFRSRRARHARARVLPRRAGEYLPAHGL